MSFQDTLFGQISTVYKHFRFIIAHDILVQPFVLSLRRYMKFFPVPANSSAKFLFEKSATYFEGDMVPRRVRALLPAAKLVSQGYSFC